MHLHTSLLSHLMTTCGVIQVHQVRISRELCTYLLYTHSTILNILRECVTHIFLSILLMNTCGMAYFLPGEQGKNTQRMSYKSDYTCIFPSYVCALMYVCTYLRIRTQSFILNIIQKCVKHSFLSIHEHPRGNHVNKVQKVSLFKTTAQLIYCSHYLRKAVSL